MAFASWIPASPGTGMPRYGCGLYDTATITHWNRQIGLPIKFLLGYTGFSNISGMVSGFYYATHTRDVPGTWSSSATGIIPVIGTSLATADGGMTLANNASGANDATWQQCMVNMFGGWGGNEIWLRLNYESNIQTTSGGYTNGNTAWAPLFKAAFEHVAGVLYAFMAASLPTKTLRILFDTCPLNFISTPNGNALSLYMPDPSTWDILGMDVYTGNCFPTDLSSWTNYASETPFTLGASTTAAPGGATDDAWATDYNASAGPNNGNPGYTYNNMGHYLCFPDAKSGSPNGGQGQSLYSLVQAALTAQKPIFHPEFGAVDATYTGGVLTGQGGAGLDLIGSQIPLTYPSSTSTEAASNDLNYFPYFKRMWAAIEAMGVPVLGFCLWDQYGGNLLSGPDAYSGAAAPGMRPSVQVFGYPIGQYGAVDPYISMSEITGSPAPIPSTVPTLGIPPNEPYTVQVNCNYAVTLTHFQADLGVGAGPQALPGSPSLVGSDSFTFTFTPAVSGSFKLVIHDTNLGYQSPPNDYVVTGTSGGGTTPPPPPPVTTATTLQQDYASLQSLGKIICVGEFRPGSQTAGDNTFQETTLISALQTQMPDAVFWQQYWDTNTSGAGWGLASVGNAATALSLPWVLNRGEFSVNPTPVQKVRTALWTWNISDGSVFQVTKPATVTITSQTLA